MQGARPYRSSLLLRISHNGYCFPIFNRLDNTIVNYFAPGSGGRSIVISASVHVSVCPRAYLPNHTRDLYLIFCACCLSSYFRTQAIRGWWDCTARAKSDIYDCLVLP